MTSAAVPGAGAPKPILPPDFGVIHTAQNNYNNASSGTGKKVAGSIAIGVGGFLIVATVAAVALPYLFNGAPNVLTMGRSLSNVGGAGSAAVNVTVTVGTLVVAGVVVLGGVHVTIGALLVNKGRKEAEEKARLQQIFNDKIHEANINFDAWKNNVSENAYDNGLNRGRDEGFRRCVTWMERHGMVFTENKNGRLEVRNDLAENHARNERLFLQQRDDLAGELTKLNKVVHYSHAGKPLVLNNGEPLPPGFIPAPVVLSSAPLGGGDDSSGSSQV